MDQAKIAVTYIVIGQNGKYIEGDELYAVDLLALQKATKVKLRNRVYEGSYTTFNGLIDSFEFDSSQGVATLNVYVKEI